MFFYSSDFIARLESLGRVAFFFSSIYFNYLNEFATLTQHGDRG